MGPDENVTPDEAAISLSDELRHEPWFSTVGVGNEADGMPVLYLYTKSQSSAKGKQLKEWKGYRVQVKNLAARPARSPVKSSSDASHSSSDHHLLDKSLAVNQSPVWTNASVRKLIKLTGEPDPVRAITQRARDVALDAMDRGWIGPPFDPLELADHLGIAVSPRYDVRDARTIPAENGRLRIEFNPNRPGPRVRYSIAHEIAHTLFPDCGECVRHRNLHEKLKADEWQLEAMCNVGAAEILMPLGSLKAVADADLTIEGLLALRKQFEVSMEALLIRVVRLTTTPVRMFCASRIESGAHAGRFVLSYAIGSQTWRADAEGAEFPPPNSALSECTAIGYTTTAVETWGSSRVRVEAVAIPPYPGSRYPRIVGILKPIGKVDRTASTSALLRFVRGDALKSRGDGNRILVQVVNDKTPNWGGGGFAEAVKRRWPEVQQDFRERVLHDRDALKLGSCRMSKTKDGILVASVVAQKGYGESARPRIRYSALRKGLEAVASAAMQHRASVHMPRIGAGQGRGSWSVIEDIVQTVFGEKDIPVTIYDLPGAPTPERMPLQEELGFAKSS